MQPSSLIFLILIAIWAAYLLQHWVRRREHLATARSVDRFSDAMRVLERRSPLRDFDLSAPRPRSYAIGPARPSREGVVVKQAQSLRPDVPTSPVASVPEAAVRRTRVSHRLTGVPARRARGLSLLASLTLVLVVSPLAAISTLPWWSVPLAVSALLADIVALRHVAVSARVRSRAEAQARESDGGSARPEARHSDYFDSGSEHVFDSERVEAPSAGAAGRAEPVEPVEVDPSAWAPVPVPPPTYTLKARAADPVPVAVVVTEPAGPDSWSLDGLVYDCELDELVERRSATGT